MKENSYNYGVSRKDLIENLEPFKTGIIRDLYVPTIGEKIEEEYFDAFIFLKPNLSLKKFRSHVRPFNWEVRRMLREKFDSFPVLYFRPYDELPSQSAKTK